jgi:alpha-galactosidase
MLVVGHVGWGANTHPTRLLPSEQYTHISLWSLLSAPLLIGCDLDKLDAFTLNLLTNDEVLAINQDPLGKQARRIFTDGLVQVWAKPLEDGSTAFGVFNLGEGETTYQLDLTKLGISLAGKAKVRDTWRQTEVKLAKGKTTLPVQLKAHGCELYVI